MPFSVLTVGYGTPLCLVFGLRDIILNHNQNSAEIIDTSVTSSYFSLMIFMRLFWLHLLVSDVSVLFNALLNRPSYVTR